MNDHLIEKLYKEEVELQFDSFSSNDSWEIGKRLVEKGSNTKNITIDITRNRQQLFHFSFDGTSLDNDEWVIRKTNLVYRFAHSSYLIGQELKLNDITIEKKYLISEAEYAPHGGCFPIFLKGSGMIGTITVSGLTQAEDHEMVVNTIRDYIKK